MDDPRYLRDRASKAHAAGQREEAKRTLYQALAQVSSPEQEYRTTVELAEQIFEKDKLFRHANTCSMYIASERPDTHARMLRRIPLLPPLDAANGYAAMRRYAQAASEFEKAGALARAAVSRERASDHAAASKLWSRLRNAPSLDTYTRALVSFNVSRTAEGSGQSVAGDAAVDAMRLLEEAADAFESQGLRERAFDCFQVLSQIGKLAGSFENVLEGYTNSIRILREDHLHNFAFQHFDEAIASSKQRNELAAAATFAKDAADYARSVGHLPLVDRYTETQGELWRGAGMKQAEAGVPPELVENAFLAAILAFGEVGRFEYVGELYRTLGSLALEDGRKAHYQRAAMRYNELPARTETRAAAKPSPRAPNDAPDVWIVDVVEWELDGDVAETCCEVLLDGSYTEATRRKALVARLRALDVSNPKKTAAQNELVEILLSMQVYAVLAPLEKLFARGEQPVRLAVLGAMQSLFFKRTFGTIRTALHSTYATEVERASKTLEQLFFQHAYDPLVRIFRETRLASVKQSCLRALTRLDTPESAEFLVSVLDHGTDLEKQATFEGLSRSRGNQFIEVAQKTLPSASPALANALRSILQARGIFL